MPQDDFIANLERLQTELPHLAERAMMFAMLTAEGTAKRDAPFTDRTGNLRNSIAAGVTKVQEHEVEGALSAGYPGIGASMEYAGFVELGTSRSAPYPYIWPALQQIVAQRVFERAFEAELRKFLGA
mgnify:CR=1 FL=1